MTTGRPRNFECIHCLGSGMSTKRGVLCPTCRGRGWARHYTPSSVQRLIEWLKAQKINQ